MDGDGRLHDRRHAVDRVEALVERYARKALTTGLPGMDSGPIGPVRTVSVTWSRRIPALAELEELLDPASMVIWTADRSQHAAIAQAVGLIEPELLNKPAAPDLIKRPCLIAWAILS